MIAGWYLTGCLAARPEYGSETIRACRGHAALKTILVAENGPENTRLIDGEKTEIEMAIWSGWNMPPDGTRTVEEARRSIVRATVF
jgi:hypothetical protein